MANKKLITSALPYVNNVPHLGNIIGSVLSADVFARYCRSRGYSTLYICGTDEYGTATEIKAIEEKTTPKEICDKYHRIHREVYEWFEIQFDYFGRTSTENHTKITQDIFLELHKNGFIAEKEIEQFYDAKVDMFLADRYLEGTCPHCGYENARGDQCDKCGKLLNPTELINPRSKITSSKPILKKTNHLFLDLEKLQPEIEKWIEEMHGTWSENTYKIAMSWMNKGLKKRSITRDLKWGVKVPLKGFENKVFYVWFDAPIGYISITADFRKDWKEWWKNEDNSDLYQFMGKDNVPFHSVIFPGTLLGTQEKWTLVKTISATEYLNYEGGKFSKSRNVGVFGSDAIESGIPADVWRYYLLINRPEKSDTDFKWNDFSDKLNSELVGNLGNLVNRTITFINRYLDGKLTKDINKGKNIKISDYLNGYAKKINDITKLMDEIKIKEALRKIMELSSMGNKYFQDNKPWVLVKKDMEKTRVILTVLANIVKDLGILIQPHMPKTSDGIFAMLNIDRKKWSNLDSLLVIDKIAKAEYLFRKIEKSEITKLRKKFGGNSDGGNNTQTVPASKSNKRIENKKMENKKKKERDITISELDIEIGEIVEIKRHPNADKLYVEKVQFHDKVIDLVSGLVPFFNENELLHKHIMIIRNLQKAKIRGQLSEGMLLAVEAKNESGEKILELLGRDLPLGTKIKFEDTQMKPLNTLSTDQLFKLNPHVDNWNFIIGNKIAFANGNPIKTREIRTGKVY